MKIQVELQEDIRGLISYYDQHKVEDMIQTHPGFVIDDFKQLLKRLEKQLKEATK